MIIKKIEVKGSGKPVASLEFRKGLNVVAGASDTGKSYVVECIHYILGGSEVPKSFKESIGYDFLEVTFEEEGSQFRLQRKLAEGADTLLMQEGSDEVVVLRGKHRKGYENLSNWFLAKLGLSDKLLLKSKENLSTQSLTLNILQHIFLIDETRIVAKYSPLGTGQFTERTLEKSLLRTLLTGEDDTTAKAARVGNESRSAIERKMTSLEELIEKLYPAQEGQQQEIEKIDNEIEGLEAEVEQADAALMSVLNKNQALLETRRSLANDINQLEDKYREESLLIDRFNLLREKYESDKSRLLGIGEAADVLDSYTMAACPTCGQPFLEDTPDEDIDLIAQSAKAEAIKIEAQLVGLNKAITGLQHSVLQVGDALQDQKMKLEEISNTLGGDLRAKIDAVNDMRAKLYARQTELTRARMTLEARNKALAELGLLMTQLGTKEADYSAKESANELDAFLKEVEGVMERWGYPDHKPLTFSDQSRDIVLGGKPRGNFGKGYRALSFSAFVIGLMSTLSQSGRHPGFVVLDSPLTTYKKGDKDRGETDESVEADMVYSFYRDLCDSYNDQQVIVFDNQEPDEDLRPLMKYEHFSKNRNVGRYGFFPPLPLSNGMNNGSE